LSLKQANESGVGDASEGFDPYLYGMPASYDEAGKYIGPDGFDPETGEWRAGSEDQRTEWERQYAEAHTRWEAHRTQLAEASAADAEAAEATSFTSEETAGEGTLSEDAGLAALRDQLNS